MAFSTRLYVQELTALLQQIDHATLEHIAQLLCATREQRNTIFCCGNGGSAATAMHFAMDLAKLTARPGQPRLRVMSLNDSVPAQTAIANDIDFREVFAEQLAGFMAPGDIVIGFSTSGRSPNVLRAMEYANEHGGVSIGITGSAESALRSIARYVVSIPATNVQRVEDVSMVVTHLLCMLTLDLLDDTAPVGVARTLGASARATLS